MDSLTSGTLAGSGSFRCDGCGYVVTLAATEDELPACPGCGGTAFSRSSLFATSRFSPGGMSSGGLERGAILAQARDQVPAPGCFLAWAEDGRVHLAPVDREWLRIGRSLAADVRFDDPTVSRRHALLVRQPDGIKLLDDRSLNGVFVNGRRVEWRTLQDGDEILVGRYRLVFVDTAAAEAAPSEPAGAAGA